MKEEIAFRKTRTGNNNAEFWKLGTLVYKITRKWDKTGNVFYVLRKIRRVRVTIVTVEKQYSNCVFVSSVIQHTKRTRRLISPSVACPAPPYLSTLSHNRHDFRKKLLLNINCVF